MERKNPAGLLDDRTPARLMRRASTTRRTACDPSPPIPPAFAGGDGVPPQRKREHHRRGDSRGAEPASVACTLLRRPALDVNKVLLVTSRAAKAVARLRPSAARSRSGTGDRRARTPRPPPKSSRVDLDPRAMELSPGSSLGGIRPLEAADGNRVVARACGTRDRGPCRARLDGLALDSPMVRADTPAVRACPSRGEAESGPKFSACAFCGTACCKGGKSRRGAQDPCRGVPRPEGLHRPGEWVYLEPSGRGARPLISWR